MASAESPAATAAPKNWILPKISELSASSEKLAEESQKDETALRTDEMRWQTEERARSEEADRLHQKQEGQMAQMARGAAAEKPLWKMKSAKSTNPPKPCK